MKLLVNFNPEDSFWEANPVVETIPEFISLKNKLGKRKSSRIMWAIAFLLDKGEGNIWRNVKPDEVEELIKEEYLKGDDFSFKDYPEQINAYKRHLMTPAQKLLMNWEEKMEERDKFIHDTPYDLDTISKLDTAMGNTEKLWSLYETIKKKLDKETSEGRLVGNAEESAIEKGLI